MRSKDELFREAQRQVALRRQQAVMQAADLEAQAHAAIPQLSVLDGRIRTLGFEAARLSATGAVQAVYNQKLE